MTQQVVCENIRARMVDESKPRITFIVRNQGDWRDTLEGETELQRQRDALTQTPLDKLPPLEFRELEFGGFEVQLEYSTLAEAEKAMPQIRKILPTIISAIFPDPQVTR